MPTSSPDAVMSWHPNVVVRAGLALVGLVGVAGIVVLVVYPQSLSGDIAMAVFVVFAGLIALGARRRCTVDAESIVIQGRFVRKTVPLKELTAADIGPNGRIWIRTGEPIDRHGRTRLAIPIIPLYFPTSGPTVKVALPHIRTRAVTAGARLVPEKTLAQQVSTDGWRGRQRIQLFGL